MKNHVEKVNENMLADIEKMQTCVINVMSVSTSVAQTIKNISMAMLNTPSSTHKSHSNRSSFVGDQSTHRLSRSRNSSVGSTASELDNSLTHHLSRSHNSSVGSTSGELDGSLTPTMMPSPSMSPRVRTGSTKKPKVSVSFKPAEKKPPSLFEQFVSKIQADNHEPELGILHYFSQQLSGALLSAVTGSLSTFKASICPRQQHKSVSTNNFCNRDSDETIVQSSTILEFTTNITFVIPSSRLIPDLKSIQSEVDKVCSSTVNMLHKVLWWGGSYGGSPLYNQLSEDPTLKELLAFLSSSILGVLM